MEISSLLSSTCFATSSPLHTTNKLTTSRLRNSSNICNNHKSSMATIRAVPTRTDRQLLRNQRCTHLFTPISTLTTIAANLPPFFKQDSNPNSTCSIKTCIRSEEMTRAGSSNKPTTNSTTNISNNSCNSCNNPNRTISRFSPAATLIVLCGALQTNLQPSLNPLLLARSTAPPATMPTKSTGDRNTKAKAQTFQCSIWMRSLHSAAAAAPLLQRRFKSLPSVGCTRIQTSSATIRASTYESTASNHWK
mmetsp:Transcript_10600/g.20091  ORF Transcript_10600/g.20091 Transcript_10600/m.20091 type:complete len:249 (-) Transcript_10600:15-761(-)